MSKAFLRESDLEEELPAPVAASTLPPGAKNYMTAEGAARLREELVRLVERERPPLAAEAADNPESKRALKALDQRVRHLEQSLSSAVIAAEAGPADDVVRFGSTVTVREADGTEERFRIVGVDEADAGLNWISWQSPLARTLLQARRGERVSLQAPRGRRELEIVGVG